MRHLFVSREFPPAPYAAGGIGTYVHNMAHLLAEAGEEVHVVAQRWPGAPRERDVQLGGRLTIHRVSMDAPIRRGTKQSTEEEIRTLLSSAMPARAWGHNAALVVESLVEEEGIDVIEAQEWEAPLYPFLLRRAIGLGPSMTPPCVIHLHSPTESVWRHNDWPLSMPYLQQMCRQEEHCLAAADALLCPSMFLADEVSSRYGLARERITVIPYPMGTAAPHRAIGRSTRGPVLYVGRLERRKGLMEFVDAAVVVARDAAGARFEFVGADVISPDGRSTRTILEERIPRALRGRFTFVGERSRAELWGHYARARFAVIPSRWENLPNTCIEAMSMGVPVLVSATGGMAEMVDHASGWIAASPTAESLELGLRRALRATDEELSGMGIAARDAVMRHCGNARILGLQLEYRRHVVEQGAARSLVVPVVPPSLGGTSRRVLPANETGAVFTARLPLLAVPPDGSAARYAVRLARQHLSQSVALVAPGYAADEDGLRAAAQVMRRSKDVGLVTGWARRGTQSTLAPLDPRFPYQWLANEAWPVAVLRSAAVATVAPPPEDLPEPYASWYLINRVLVTGWKAVSVPAILADATTDPPPGHPEAATDRWLEMRRRMSLLFADEIAPDAAAILALLEPQPETSPPAPTVYGPDRWTGLTLSRVLRLRPRDQLALLGELAHNPWRVGAWLRTRLTRQGAPATNGEA